MMTLNRNAYSERKLESSPHSQGIKNPLRADACDMDDDQKIERIANCFEEIIDILGLDRSNDSIRNTPNRIAKMYVTEIFKGLNPKNKPLISLFENEFNYHTPLVELNIPFTSFCEHHFVPIKGIANIAYIPQDYIIGLSKIHRIVDFYARRPQVQERLTMQIQQELSSTLIIRDIGVVLKANHSCISCRGVEASGSSTLTSVFKGQIKNDQNLIQILLGSSSV